MPEPPETALPEALLAAPEAGRAIFFDLLATRYTRQAGGSVAGSVRRRDESG